MVYFWDFATKKKRHVHRKHLTLDIRYIHKGDQVGSVSFCIGKLVCVSFKKKNRVRFFSDIGGYALVTKLPSFIM